MVKKLLYVEDMKECYEKTKSTIGSEYIIDWKTDFIDAFNAIKNLEEYSAGIFDINLDYDSTLPEDKQTTQGFDLIRFAKMERERRKIHFPIICVTGNIKYKSRAMILGADKFLCKKEFWKNANNFLEEIIGTR